MDTDVGEHWTEQSFKVLVSESTGDTKGITQSSVSRFFLWKGLDMDTTS